jgi:hypothetical protein
MGQHRYSFFVNFLYQQAIMKKSILYFNIAIFCSILFFCGCSSPSMTNISPNQNNGVVGLFDEPSSHQGGKSASGLVINMAVMSMGCMPSDSIRGFGRPS